MTEQSIMTEIKYLCKGIDEIKSEIKDFKKYCDDNRKDCGSCNDGKYASRIEMNAVKEDVVEIKDDMKWFKRGIISSLLVAVGSLVKSMFF